MSGWFSSRYEYIYKKRLNSELELLKNYKNCNNVYTEYINEKKTYFYFKYKNNNFRVCITGNYPFVSPSLEIIFFNDNDNEKIILSYVEYFYKLLFFYKPFFPYECPCCFNQQYNWTPKNKIIDLLSDIDKYTSILQELIEKYYCNKIDIVNSDLIQNISDFL